MAVSDYKIGDRVITRKKHPCGGDRWEITRIGADIKLRCETWGRIVMLDSVSFQKAVKCRIEEKEPH